MVSIYDLALGINIGLSFLVWFIYLSIFLSLIIRGRLVISGFPQEFLNRAFSNLLISSILFLSTTNWAFENAYGNKLFYFMKNLSFSSLIFISPLVIRLNWTKMLSIDRAFLTMYIIVFFIVFAMIVIDLMLNILSLKILIVFIGIAVVLMESSIFGGIYARYLNTSDKLLGMGYATLPSLLSASLLIDVSKNLMIIAISQIILCFVSLVIFYKMIFNLSGVYEEYKKVMDDFAKKIKNEEKIFSWFTVMLVSLLEARDPYTRGHSERVAKYSYNLAKLYYNNTFMPNFIEMGALLHDIGKIGVRDEVLFFPSRLSEEMYNEMKSHPSIGKELLSSVSLFRDVSDIAYLHHERIDGNGYPLGIKGDNIPDYIKITTISDSFDAMNSSRVYRKNLDFDKIKEELISNGRKQFDEKLVKLFVENINKIV